MGQYYEAINITNRIRMKPLTYWESSKLTGHSFIWDAFVNTFIVNNLIEDPSIVSWAGDYSKFYKDSKFDLFNENGDIKWDEFSPIRCTITNPVKIILNIDTNEYVSIPNYKVWVDMYHPLPLLTCEWNWAWGGDYYQDNDYVGYWFRNNLIAFETIKDFKNFVKENNLWEVKEIIPNF